MNLQICTIYFCFFLQYFTIFCFCRVIHIIVLEIRFEILYYLESRYKFPK